MLIYVKSNKEAKTDACARYLRSELKKRLGDKYTGNEEVIDLTGMEWDDDINQVKEAGERSIASDEEDDVDMVRNAHAPNEKMLTQNGKQNEIATSQVLGDVHLNSAAAQEEESQLLTANPVTQAPLVDTAVTQVSYWMGAFCCCCCCYTPE